jgi:sulfatase modifying factor 1
MKLNWKQSFFFASILAALVLAAIIGSFLYSKKRDKKPIPSKTTVQPIAHVDSLAKQTAEASSGMVLIKGGTFMMGSNTGYADEKPVHKVTVSGLYMDKTEITQAEYERVMGANPSIFKDCRNCPVEQVSWDDADAYCRKVGKRLPTEAEWEYAARAGSATKYYWGNDVDTGYAWYNENSGSNTHPVGRKKPNAWGLYDMSGNVWEWCSDWYASYNKTSPVQDSEEPEELKTLRQKQRKRVLRGGSWNDNKYYLRSSFRYFYNAEVRDYYVGFRCARDQDTQDSKRINR